jgi:hypothetical protein
MLPSLLALLLVAGQEDRNRHYHRVAVRDIPSTTWTHVCTTGTVGMVRRQGDGDVHVRLDDEGAFVMLEIIPTLFLPRPKIGQHIVACGITREDKGHRFWELHPLETWAVMAGRTGAGRP